MATMHATLSASGSHRWISCPGSVSAEASAPSQPPSIFADEGSGAHELGEYVLVNGGNCHTWIGKHLNEHNAIQVSREMADNVQMYVDFVRGLGGQQWYERRVDFSGWVPDGFGTSDAIVVAGTTLHVVDLKYGKGVRVDAKNNTQGMLYALGAFAEMEFAHKIERVTITIVQPRMDHVDEWTITVDELLKWGERIAQAAAATQAPDAPRRPGEDQCRFCRAKATCPELLKLTHETVGESFDSLDAVDKLPDEKLRRVMDNKRLILGWLDAVEAYIRQRIESGQEFTGYKLVDGRSVRDWADEAKASEVLIGLLGDAAHERKILSPAKAEKALKKDQRAVIEPLIDKRAGAPSLVPNSDPRPAIGATADDFNF